MERGQNIIGDLGRNKLFLTYGPFLDSEYWILCRTSLALYQAFIYVAYLEYHCLLGFVSFLGCGCKKK
ncbi:hypothetical protein ARMSODRAFT_1083770 [Armillaria solidipes]|uniref:Uncharacterized protein n=1 Tax=Armillaria solidipes TaxID=1076256 RepID=A0A2H3C1N3_9AGAR|nr:hypothetical protein ARMSODRAFT_1083770 [Armillaria solidipes]